MGKQSVFTLSKEEQEAFIEELREDLKREGLRTVSIHRDPVYHPLTHKPLYTDKTIVINLRVVHDK